MRIGKGAELWIHHGSGEHITTILYDSVTGR